MAYKNQKKNSNESKNRYHAKNNPKDAPRNSSIGSKYEKLAKQMEGHSSNDITWWNRSALYNSSTRIPFNVLSGTAPIESGTSFENPRQVAVPGIMRIDFVPGIGTAYNQKDAVNRAFNMLYADVVKATTGALQMQQMDMAIYTLQCSSLACGIGFAKRLFGLVNVYSRYNFYYPTDIIEASNINWKDFKDNKTMYMNRLKDIIARFNRLSFLAFSYLPVRQYSLAHNLYIDQDDPRAQIMLFQPTGYFVESDPGVLDLKYVKYTCTDTRTTFGRLLNEIEDCLVAIENSSFGSIVRGNILRAFGDKTTVSQDQVDDNYVVTPVCDRNIAWQIEHMRWLPVDYDTIKITTIPERNVLQFVPGFKFAASEHMASIINRNYLYLNTDKDNQTDEFIMEATRLIPGVAIGSFYENHELSGKYSLAPTELVDKVTIYTIVKDAATNEAALHAFQIPMSDYGTFTSPEDMTTFLETVGLMAPFRVKPRLYWTSDTNEPFGSGFDLQFSDLNMWTHLHEDQLEQLHIAALLSVYSAITE